MDADLISKVNRLQDIFNQIGGETVDLPQIAVVGSQSSGKSSVLETFVGHDFLPRGTGIVTRRPLILQLIHVQSSTSNTSQQPSSTTTTNNSNTNGTGPRGPELYSKSKSLSKAASSKASSNYNAIEFAEFLHTGDRRFYDFDEIRDEIENETIRLAGKDKGIHPNPINLKVYSPNVVNLTLVDLPGLTKNPIGEQPSDIERRIRDLVESYISKPNCIILAVSPANLDLANSDSLKLARQVDPRCLRTVGVLTKLDLMDPGTHALDILQGRGGYPLKLGFIGVVNRSQRDIDDGKSLEEAISDEQQFFKNHPVYKSISYKSGTSHLARTLNSVLLNHIRDRLPDMKARLNTLIGQTQQELREFGDPTFMGDSHRGSLVLKLMTQFATDFMASIDGTSAHASIKELGGGARIYYIFDETFGHALDSINPTDNLTNQDIMTAIRNAKGPRPRLFAPEAAFDLLIKPQIKLLELPALRCVQLVYEELMKICHNCTSIELQRYPRLHGRIIEVVSDLLRERLGPTSEYVESLISIQVAYINTNHPDFIRNTATSDSNSSTAFEHQIENSAFNQEQTTTVNSNAVVTTKHRSVGVNDRMDKPDQASNAAEHDHAQDMSYLLHPNGPSSGSSSLPHTRPRSENDQRPPAAPNVHHRYGSESGTSRNQVQNAINGAEPAHRTATDAFMQYFLGGGGSGGSSSGGFKQPSQVDNRSRRNVQNSIQEDPKANENVPGYDIGNDPIDAPLMAARDGRAAAYDMKSLERHLEAIPGDEEGSRFSERDLMETNFMRTLIVSYFAIVRRSIQDLVPKAIMHLLVNFSRESVQNRLVASLFKESLFEELLYEDENLTAERTRVKNLLDAYREAFKTLSDVL